MAMTDTLPPETQAAVLNVVAATTAPGMLITGSICIRCFRQDAHDIAYSLCVFVAPVNVVPPANESLFASAPERAPLTLASSDKARTVI